MQHKPIANKRRGFCLAVSVVSMLMISALVVPDSAQPAPPDIANTAIFATNSIWVQQSSDVLSGDVVVNDASAGPFLDSEKSLTIAREATTPAGFAVRADTIKVDAPNAVVGGDAFCNELDDATGTVTCSPLSLPVFASLPAFVAQAPAAGAADILVPKNGSIVLFAGDYGDITVKQNGSVQFTGGIYNVRSIDSDKSSDLFFDSASEIRVKGKLVIDKDSFVGPSAGSGIGAADIIFYVAGINGNSGNLGATPEAASIGKNSNVQANFYVPNGTLHFQQNSSNTGAFLARDVKVGKNSSVTLASAFGGNQSPVADPQTVSTAGAASITIDLTGSDPDGDDLTFSIADDPLNGTVTVDQAPVGTPNDTVATATYTPSDATANLEDSFTFDVDDGNGGTATAVVIVVIINPNQAPTANAQSLFTAGAASITIDLTGDNPNGDDLTFSIVIPPVNGTLVLDQAPAGFPGNPPGCDDDTVPCIESPRNDTGATATYTPTDAPANLADSFVFEVNDGNGKTAQATVQINPGLTDVANVFFGGEASATTVVNTDVTIFFLLTTTGVPGTGTSQCTEFTCAVPAGTLTDFQDRADPDAGLLKPSAIYTPVQDFLGTDTFEFEGCETAGPPKTNCGQGFATIAILPVTSDQTVSTLVETPVAIRLTSNGGQCFLIVNGPKNGTLTSTNPPGPFGLPGPDYEYVPNSGPPVFTGTDSFTFAVGNPISSNPVICSNDAEAVVTINVNPVDCKSVAGACDAGIVAGARTCPEPFVLVGNDCLCNPPFEFVDNQCQIPDPVTCDPPKQIIEGVCTDVEA